MSVAILVPVLNRPQNVEPLIGSIETTTDVSFRIVFLVDEGDAEEAAAVHLAEARHEAVQSIEGQLGNYAEKINLGVRMTEEPLLFLGADDLRFEPGWFGAAKSKIDEGAQVVGVNDLLDRRRQHATHFLITREYAQQPTLDGQPGPLPTVYEHNFVDDELIATASKRDVYTYAEDSHVRHLHPMNGLAEMDETYQRGCATMRIDRRRFHKRQTLWT